METGEEHGTLAPACRGAYRERTPPVSWPSMAIRNRDSVEGVA